MNDTRQDDMTAGGDHSDASVFERTQERLDGARILLVEDEAIVAMDIRLALTDAGAKVLGPAASLPDARALAQDALCIDGAILDIDLGGEDVFALAEMLVSRAVPFVFHTGARAVAEIEAQFPEAPVVRKPVTIETLLLRLVDRMG